MMDQLQFDLSIVKKESQYFEDYGQNGGNLLDNIIPDPDFDHFGQGANVVSRTVLSRFRFSRHPVDFPPRRITLL